MNLRAFRLILPLALLCALAAGCSNESFDIVISGGTVVDGTGNPAVRADIGIQDGVITKVGSIPVSQGKTVIDAAGKYVTPGFIDIHTHGDRMILDPDGKNARNYITQGVTTLVTGNCGEGTYDVADYFSTMETQGAAVNIVHLAGHGTVRESVMGSADRAPTPEEMARMKKLVEKAMQEGAAGLSTGLFYAPGSYAETSEIVELARVVAPYGGIYASHIRDESDYTIGLEAAIREAIEIGEQAGVPVEISHIKALGKPVWGRAPEVCRIIEEARGRGLRVFADQYPYNASSTSLAAAALPRWVQAGGKTRERLTDRKLLPGIKKEIAANIERRGGPDTLVVSSFPARPEWEGKSLEEISAELGNDPVDTAIELVLAGGPGVISFNMSDDDIVTFMKKPWVMTCSDGDIVRFGRGVPHPRSYGAFVKKIRKYVLDEKVLPMEQAIRAATGLPAEMLGLDDRGLIEEGRAADIVVFDPDTIRDTATFSKPHQYAEGIDTVLVNGKAAVAGGKYTGTLAGKPLRHTGRQLES